MRHKIIIIVGARPNFMKVAPLVRSIKEYNVQKKHKNSRICYLLVHTGQHYDREMSESFFDQLKLPVPDIYLGVGSGTHAQQTAKIMIEFEKVCFKQKPDIVVVVGDVNSTMACSVVAAKAVIPVAHVEAGLRSFDRTMPEEINRIITDHLSDYLFTTCEDANANLIREGIPQNKIFFVGNVMIDTLRNHIGIASKSHILEKLSLKNNGQTRKYCLLTLHRPSNVDEPAVLESILRALLELSSNYPIIFPMHPRTLKQVRKYHLLDKMIYVQQLSSLKLDENRTGIVATPPLSYLDFLCLMSKASLVLTDSGGIQEETTILGVPCLTIRNNTERPITIREGTNNLIGNDPERIKKAALRILKKSKIRKRTPKFWDGKAADRIIKVLASRF